MEGILAIKKNIIDALMASLVETQNKGLLPPLANFEITLERPQNSEHGDFATSLPLKIARACGINPTVIAQHLAGAIVPPPELATINVASPGFINFTLKKEWLSRQVAEIYADRVTFGNVELGHGERIQIEFVSANPTGPLHVGHGRGAVLGCTLANILTAAGYSVNREYYINDAGNQMNAFYRSLWARYQQHFGRDTTMPSDGYLGLYLVDLAREIASDSGECFLAMDEDESQIALGKIGIDRMLGMIKDDLQTLGVCFDNWFSEQSLFVNGQYERILTMLKANNHTVDRENAIWFNSSACGDDKDNVLVRSDGTPTYFATDVAYHYNKFVERQMDTVIDIWGADHQGHVSRMQAALGALGVDPSRLHIIVSQLVTLKRGSECVKLSKRSGDIITLRDVVDEVGADACRFFFLTRSADSQMDFDLELAKQQSSENPVYYIQYAHARIASILDLASSENLTIKDEDDISYSDEAELALIRKMVQLPEIVEMSAQLLEPHHLPHYALELAGAFHAFYKKCRVISKDDTLQTSARLHLITAAKLVLARTLNLMGLSTPDQM